MIISSTISWPCFYYCSILFQDWPLLWKGQWSPRFASLRCLFPTMTSTGNCVVLMLKFTDITRIYFILCSFSGNSFQWTDLVLYFRNIFLNYITECVLVCSPFSFSGTLFFLWEVFCFLCFIFSLNTFIFLFFSIFFYIPSLSLSSVLLILLSAMPYFFLSLFDHSFYFCDRFITKFQFFLKVCQLTFNSLHGLFLFYVISYLTVNGLFLQLSFL